MDFQPVTYTVDKIISLLSAGRLALPEFQRDFVWSPAKVVELLDSVSRGWPIGSLLLLRGPQPFEAKSIDGGPALRGEVDVFVLDGQQRITALYHSLADVSDICYYIDFDAIAKGGRDYIFWKRRAQFEREFATPKLRAHKRIALIQEVADNEAFFRWQGYLPGEAAHKALALRETYLSGLKSKVYRLPVVELEHEIELEALARIFETINRTGVKLNAFDLMVAVLYPHKFNLRNEWEDAVVRHSPLKDFEIDGVEILKLIAIWVRRDQQARASRVTVRGVRQGDVLAVPPAAVKENWSRAIESYVAALDYLEKKLGVVHPSLAPPQAMILAMAAFFDTAMETAVPSSRIWNWYWNSIRTQSYAQGANTRVVADVDKALRPTLVDLEFGEGVDLSAAMLEPVRRNKILVNGVGCALSLNGARDIKTGLLLDSENVGPVVGRSLHALSRGEARPDENAVVASVVYGKESSMYQIAADVRRGVPLEIACNRDGLSTQLVDSVDLGPDLVQKRAAKLEALLGQGVENGR